MRILITGATGFVGVNLINELVKNQHAIAVLHRDLSKIHLFEKFNNIMYFDISNLTNINYAIDTFMPDIVIHLATKYVSSHSYLDIESLVESNITLGTMLLDSMTRAGVKKILNFATRWQHVDNRERSPVNLYAATKVAFNDLLEYYAKKGIMHHTLELCDTFGPFDNRQKIVDLMFTACLDKKEILLTPGNQVIDLVHIQSLAEFVSRHVGDEGFYSNTTSTISGNEIKLRELGRLIETVCGAEGFLIWGGSNYRPNELMSPISFYPKISLSSTSLLQDLKVHHDYLLLKKNQ